jgi:hypothetical protein
MKPVYIALAMAIPMIVLAIAIHPTPCASPVHPDSVEVTPVTLQPMPRADSLPYADGSAVQTGGR